ncbi:MAG: hypothetical protein JW827_01190 [Spirochaetes bacterium]|nr:hypothetical protein [Spirochaetota bacterium]
MKNKKIFLTLVMSVLCLFVLQSYSIFTGKKKAIIEKSGLEDEVKVKLNLVAPVITEPAVHYHFVGDSITVKGAARGDMEAIELKLDSGEWISLPAAGSWEYTFSSVGLGTHHVYARIRTQDQYSAESSVQFNTGKVFGGMDNDYTVSGQQTADGGYIAVGTTYSFEPEKPSCYFLKVNASGKKQWQKAIHNHGDDLKGTSVQQTSDGGYVFTSYNESFWYAYMVKCDSSGNITWTNIYDLGGNVVWISAVKQASDNGYILTGELWLSDMFLLKADATGATQWLRVFGDSSYESGNAIVEDKYNSGFVSAGYSQSYGFNGTEDVFIAKVDTNGNTLWTNVIGSFGNEQAQDIKQTSDQGYIMAGWTSSYGEGGYDVYLVKCDQNGQVQWQKSFGGPYNDYGLSVQQTSDGGYIIAGTTRSFGAGNYDVYLIKTDSAGNLSWYRTFGGADDDNYESTPVFPCSVQQTTDGGYVVIGTGKSFGVNNSYDAYLIKTDANGY